MSTSESARDELVRRYYAGEPARDEVERAAYREWAELDAADHEAALDERPDAEYNHYEGPLDWPEWLEERERSRRLEDLGIHPVQLPEPFDGALRGHRADRIAREVEDRLARWAVSPPDQEALATDARGYGAAARALDVALSRRVVALEDRQAVLKNALTEASKVEADLESTVVFAEDEFERQRAQADLAAHRADWAGSRRRLGELEQQLDTLSREPGHPDRWGPKHEQAFRDGLAARLEFRRRRELGATRDQGARQSGFGSEQAPRAMSAEGLEPPF